MNLVPAADFAAPAGARPPRDYTLRGEVTNYALLAGLPGDCGARSAACTAFADLKLSFLHALEAVPGADWLRTQVLSAEQPVDLWLLRAAAFDVLSGTDTERRSRRQLLRRGLDSMFPELEPDSGFCPL